MYPPEVYNMLYYSNVCHVCKKPDSNLKRCVKCKVLSYCCKIHQKVDWPIHKQLCSIIASTNKIIGSSNLEKNYMNFSEFKELQTLRSLCWRKGLQRDLERFEQNMLQFPRICAVCFTDKVEFDCRQCLNVSYCCEDHRNIHKNIHERFCDELSLCMDLDFKYLTYCAKHNIKNVFGTNKPWQFGNGKILFVKNDMQLPRDLKEFLNLYDSRGTSLNSVEDMLRTDSVSAACIILQSMKEVNLLNKLSKLVIHIVGADFTEVSLYWDVVTELHMKWFTHTYELRYYVIGPEVKDNEYPFSKGTVKFIQGLYHDIVDGIDKPTVVVAYNSGIHEFCGKDTDTWHRSIGSLVKYDNVPLILTAYTIDEIKKDVDIVQSIAGGNVLDPKLNPFKSLRPIRNYDDPNIPVFYKNGYYSIIMKQFNCETLVL